MRLFDKLKAAIREQPADLRDGFRIVQLKEKFGRLTVYQDRGGTPEMADRAFPSGGLAAVAKIGVLVGSILAGGLGALVLVTGFRGPARSAAPAR